MKMIPVDVNQNESILSKEALNGRVNIIEIPEDVRFQMQEKIAVKNKLYVRAAAAGINSKAPTAMNIKPKDMPFRYPILFKNHEEGSAMTTKEM